MVKLLVGWNQSAFQTLLGFVRQGGVGGGGLKQGTRISFWDLCAYFEEEFWAPTFVWHSAQKSFWMHWYFVQTRLVYIFIHSWWVVVSAWVIGSWSLGYIFVLHCPFYLIWGLKNFKTEVCAMIALLSLLGLYQGWSYSLLCNMCHTVQWCHLIILACVLLRGTSHIGCAVTLKLDKNKSAKQILTQDNQTKNKLSLCGYF